MRVLVRCPKCHRQYDATGYAPGARFHCHCGTVVSVPAERHGMESRVVRCSACGAALEGGGGTCPHCGEDLSLYDKDLHTVCPGCCARISDRSKYCNRCGVEIRSQERVGKETAKPCPVCGEGRPLHDRGLKDQGGTLLECPGCAGLWLCHKAFEELKKEAEVGTHPIGTRPVASASAANRGTKGPYYRKCPDCSSMMHRENFGGMSGVVIDVCSDHGLWFDDAELPEVLDWVRRGGLQRSKEVEKERDSAPRSMARTPEFPTVRVGPPNPAAAIVAKLLAVFFTR